jgi:3-deoxy-7-phosphoheptulonate synthase
MLKSNPHKTYHPLPSPVALKRNLPLTEKASLTVERGRESVRQILFKGAQRLLVVVGPCSIHDVEMAFEYASRLKNLQRAVKSTLFLVMRAYFEKPRTGAGWKGMLTDPNLDNTCDIAEGLNRARNLLLKIGEIGVPAATEFLSPTTSAYFGDLITWAVVGARTAESQIHREVASGLKMPVGFKNSTVGELAPPINAIKIASAPQSYRGIDQKGRVCIVRASGNPWSHIVLRGGRQPNYDAERINLACQRLAENRLSKVIMIDFSHGNSNNVHSRQGHVWRNVISQRIAGNEAIVGMMLESHLNPCSQPLSGEHSSLAYGVSITDACIGWEESERLIRWAHGKLSDIWSR